MTPADKAAFQRFRKWEMANPQLAYPTQFKRWEQVWKDAGEEVNAADFTLQLAQQMWQEDEDAAERAIAAKVEARTAVEPVRPAVAEV